MTIQETVWNYLRGKNLPEKSVSAVMGNIQGESSFDETQIEVGSGIGFGLCQWSYGRRTQLEAYGTDLNHQLDFLWSELSGENTSVTGANYQWINKSGYLNHEDFINGNGSIEDLTSAFCFCWERPAVEYAHLDVRQASAISYYNQFSGSTYSNGIYMKLVYPYWFGSNIKISFNINKFLLLTTHGNVVQIQNDLTKRKYYVNISSVRIL